MIRPFLIAALGQLWFNKYLQLFVIPDFIIDTREHERQKIPVLINQRLNPLFFLRNCDGGYAKLIPESLFYKMRHAGNTKALKASCLILCHFYNLLEDAIPSGIIIAVSIPCLFSSLCNIERQHCL